MNTLFKVRLLIVYLCGIALFSQPVFAGQNQPSTTGAALWLTNGDGSGNACYPTTVPLSAGFQFASYSVSGASFRVRLEYKRFDLQLVGLGMVILNESITQTIYTPVKVPTTGGTALFNTSYFYGASYPMHFASATGYYRVTTTLQQFAGSAWTDIETLTSPHYYVAPNDNNRILAPYVSVGKANTLAVDFKVNNTAGWVSGIGLPPVLYTCNPLSVIMDHISGTTESMTITLTKGNWSSGGFAALPGSSNTTSQYIVQNPGAIPDQALHSMFSTFLTGYEGYLQVSLTIDQNGCDNINDIPTKSQVFKLGNPVQFKLHTSATGCNNGQVDRVTTLPISTVNFSGPPCQNGWVGAFTGGVESATFAGVGTVTSCTQTVQEVNPNTGAVIGANLGSISSSSVPNSLTQFVSIVGLYFVTNFPGVASNNRTFKYTLSVTANGCSASNFTYFRIAQDGSGGGQTWDAKVPVAKADGAPLIYPNPANDQVNIKYAGFDEKAYIIIYDQTGRKVLSQSSLRNNTEINISSLSKGIYLYTIVSGAEAFHGKFGKN